ncbi:MAG: cytochrome-c peroxidase, partial [Planctomycetia bacterium]
VLPAADATPLSLAEIEKFLANPAHHESVAPKTLVGLPDVAPFIPKDNPMTIAKVELGRLLYFDGRLSRDTSVSCATCHEPDVGWSSRQPVGVGINEQKGGRHSPSVMNRVFGKVQFWDGRAASLEEQALGPIQNPIEMGFTLPELEKRLKENEVYTLFFKKVFGGEPNSDGVAKAIAAFERTVLAGANPNDFHERAAKAKQLDPDEIEELEDEEKSRIKEVLADAAEHPLGAAGERGRTLYFGKAKCAVCHVGQNLSDELFYNIGVGMDKENPDVGREAVSKQTADFGGFRTPSLRNIADTAPYRHDGSQKTLEEVVDYYDKGGHPNRGLSSRIEKLNLSAAEKADLVAFMKDGLQGTVTQVKPPRLP